ncbi:MAG: DUF177 domain-containing protein [Cellulophaga sp.]
MIKLKEYTIPFSGLKQGKHAFEYEIENMFFESFGYNEFNTAKVKLKAELNIISTMMELEIVANGIANINCDVTNEPFDQDIDTSIKLVVKFGEEYNDENDEILILPHRVNEINISQFIYEMLVLAIPTKRVHPGVLDGTLESDALNKLEELQPKETIDTKEDNDPRWDVLKKLI